VEFDVPSRLIELKRTALAQFAPTREERAKLDGKSNSTLAENWFHAASVAAQDRRGPPKFVGHSKRAQRPPTTDIAA
jgi:hypothetical protein